MSDIDDLQAEYGENYDSEGGIDYGDDGGTVGRGGGGGSSNGSDDGDDDDDDSGSSFSEGDDAGDRDSGEELNFGEAYADLSRTTAGPLGGTQARGAKSMRTAEDTAKEKAEGIMSGERMYEANKLNLISKEREKILSSIANTSNVERLSIEVYVLALLFDLRYKREEDIEKDFQAFFKKTNGIEAVDLLRYVRMIKSAKKAKEKEEESED